MNEIFAFVVAIYNNFTAELDIQFIMETNEVNAIKSALVNNAANLVVKTEEREKIIAETKEWLETFPEDLNEVYDILVNAEYVVKCTKNINQ